MSIYESLVSIKLGEGIDSQRSNVCYECDEKKQNS